MPDSFYVPRGDDAWLATRHTTGPWDPGAQHGGPPSALLGRAAERCEPRGDMIIARFTVEILGPIPVGELTVRARLARPGRSVEMLEAAAVAEGREVARARAWRVLRTDCQSVPAGGTGPGPVPATAVTGLPEGWVDGYLSAIEWRWLSGGFATPGPGAVWARLRYPLVADEPDSPLARVLAVADSGSGLSGTLDLTSWVFINPELTVHLHREARGEWIHMDSQTTISSGGAGLATTVLSDPDGPVGAGTQALLIAPRHRSSLP